MAIVVNATRSLSVPRQVLNVAYSLERKQAIKFPELGTFDTQWGTNREGKHTMNLVFVGGNAENVRAVQGLMEDLRSATVRLWLTELMPWVLPSSTLRAMGAGISDESREEKGGLRYAKAIGVFSPSFVLISCIFHALTQRMADPQHFGSTGVLPTVYDKIQFTLNRVATYCETRREAKITLQCLRAFGRRVLRAEKFAKLCVNIIDHSEATMGDWALFAFIYAMTLAQKAGSRVESDHSVYTRLKNGGFGLGSNSELHAALDKGVAKSEIRQSERELALYRTFITCVYSSQNG